MQSTEGIPKWLLRMGRPKSKKTTDDEQLLKKIQKIHHDTRRSYGRMKITRAIRRSDHVVNYKRIERLMKHAGIRSKVAKKYKATTNSKHNLPVAENILNREFKADKPNQKMVSDITYIWTEEVWFYLQYVP